MTGGQTDNPSRLNLRAPAAPGVSGVSWRQLGVGDRELGGHVRRSLLVSSTAGALPTAPITNTLSPVKSNIFWASSNHSSEPNSDRLNWRASPQPALPVEVAPPLLGRLDAGQLAAVVGQLASATLDQPRPPRHLSPCRPI